MTNINLYTVVPNQQTGVPEITTPHKADQVRRMIAMYDIPGHGWQSVYYGEKIDRDELEKKLKEVVRIMEDAE